MGIKLKFIKRIKSFNLFKKAMLGGMVGTQRLKLLEEYPESVVKLPDDNQELKSTFSDNGEEYTVISEEQKKVR